MTLVSELHPVVLKAGTDEASRILQDYAEFWKIPYRMNLLEPKGSVLFTSDRSIAAESAIHGPVILTPVGLEEAEKMASYAGAAVTSEKKLVRLPVRKGITVSLRTNVYEYSGQRIEPLLVSDGATIMSRVLGSNVHLVGLDLVTEYARLIHEGYEQIPSRRFSLVAKLPFSYQSIPSFIRNRSFRTEKGLSDLREENLGPVECLRAVFLASLVRIAGPIPRIGFWRRGKAYALSVTHDVETQDGLENGAKILMETEATLKIRSTWNIPSDRYPLTSPVLTILARNGEVGAHDTRHDGRLIFLSGEEKKRRLASCRARLERLVDQRIRGFRAPLLQHNKDLAEALYNAGFEFDSSCPSWEVLSPTSLRSHGVGTIFPFYMRNILEIPVSLPQDHQLIRVAGQKPSAAVDLLLKLATWIRGVGGACILLIHPDYEFAEAENKKEYERLLESFRSDPECDIMTLGEMGEWWKTRKEARIETNDNKVSIISSEHSHMSSELQAELVTGYSGDGFSVVNL